MNVIKFGVKYDKPLAIALGFFDCIHIGHRLLVDSTRTYAAKIGGESAVFTFSNDPSNLLGGEKQIYSLSERASALCDLGLDNLIYTEFDEEFAIKSPAEFLNELTSQLNIKAIVVGLDYRFGKNAEGEISYLKQYCDENGILLDVKQFQTANQHKISTSELKKFVKSGDIRLLNSYLTQPYFTVGKVEHARGIGSSVLGYPTANIKMDECKLALSDGIYATRLYVDGKCHDSMTNVGSKPTFSVKTPSIETFIFDFNGDLYGKQVKLAFYERTRNVTKFKSADELKMQLQTDETQIRAILSDIKRELI